MESEHFPTDEYEKLKDERRAIRKSLREIRKIEEKIKEIKRETRDRVKRLEEKYPEWGIWEFLFPIIQYRTIELGYLLDK